MHYMDITFIFPILLMSTVLFPAFMKHDWAFPLMPNVPTCVRNVGIGFLATGYGYAPMTFLMLIYSLIHCDQKKSSIGFQSLNFSKTLRY